MPIQLQLANDDDAPGLVRLREAVNARLVEEFGPGFWCMALSEHGALAAVRQAQVYVARHRGGIAATLALTARKPWAIDLSYFEPRERPFYLTNMAVHPEFQRQGVGCEALHEARRIALASGGDAIRLDAYDVPAGAGPFYAKCGFTEAGRAVYRSAPLIYYEMQLNGKPASYF
ncbi:GNAT family N-acetyltransferase [Terracidiphilus sp.]|jgi:GNAT superfamily N-acetyltransferase|uniref:GNAT family N-acetyltransferase n=1 Tax=Terracidiphilus sp. TaxID=1964191 RepID=UPI003C149EA8